MKEYWGMVPCRGSLQSKIMEVEAVGVFQAFQ